MRIRWFATQHQEWIKVTEFIRINSHDALTKYMEKLIKTNSRRIKALWRAEPYLYTIYTGDLL